ELARIGFKILPYLPKKWKFSKQKVGEGENEFYDCGKALVCPINSQFFPDGTFSIQKLDDPFPSGVKPIFRPNEIRDKLQIVKSMIHNKLGLNKKMGARNLAVSKMPYQVAKNFMDEN